MRNRPRGSAMKPHGILRLATGRLTGEIADGIEKILSSKDREGWANRLFRLSAASLVLHLFLAAMPAPGPRQWDKEKHVAMGILIAGASLAAGTSRLTACALSLTAGIGKEVIDAQGFGNVEMTDILATTMGCLPPAAW